MATSLTECIDMCQCERECDRNARRIARDPFADDMPTSSDQNDHRDQYGGKPCEAFGYQEGLNNCDFYSDNFATVHKQDTPASYGKVWVGGMIEGLDCAGYAAGGFVLREYNFFGIQ